MLLAAATATGFLLNHDTSLASQALVYVLAVVIASYTLSLLASVGCALGAVTAFNFFFVPPRWTFSVDSQEHLIALSVMLLVALSISHLSTRLRRETQVAGLNAKRAQQLQAFATSLSSADSAQDLEMLGQQALEAAFDGPVNLVLLQADGRFEPGASLDSGTADGLQSCMREAAALGPGTGRWPGLNAWYLPLGNQGHMQGAVCIQDIEAADTQGREHALALCALLTQALWRLKLAQAMRNKIVDEVRITPAEVKIFYEKIPKDSLLLYESEVEIGQIVVFPKASRDAEEYCKEQLIKYKQDIESKKKDFCSVANLYSQDPGSKDNCGKYDVNRNSKEMDPVWLSKAFLLKDGQISNPFKTRFGYHIIQMVSRAGDDAAVRHILLVPQVTSIEMKTGFERLDSVRAKLIVGTMQFGEAVAKYSDDEGSKFTAGMLQGQSGSFLTIDQLDKDMVAMLKDLKVGQYSQPVPYTDERGRKGIRIVYLKSKTEPHRENLKDDYNRVSQRALEEKKNDALEKWFSKKIPTYYIMIDDEYRNCEEMQKWVSAMNAKKN